MGEPTCIWEMVTQSDVLIVSDFGLTMGWNDPVVCKVCSSDLEKYCALIVLSNLGACDH